MDDTWVEVHYAGKRLCSALSTRILAADKDECQPIINPQPTAAAPKHCLPKPSG